jgi:flavin-dependent dehydrogenase
MKRPAYVIPRQVFDARIVDAAVAAGAQFERHTVREIHRSGNHIHIDDFRARTLIGADGANSVVRTFLGAKRNPPGHIAIAIRGYAVQPPEAEVLQHLVLAKNSWPAYAWSFPIGNGLRNVGYGELLRGKPLARAHLLERLNALLPGLGEITGLKAHYLPLSTWRPPPGRGNILLAGDALSLINPFTGEGIYYALLSGALAGEAAAMAGPLAAHYYRRTLRGHLARHLRHTTLTAKLAARSWIADAGIRAAASDQRVFDTFVELGLGRGTLDAHLLRAVARPIARRARPSAS